MSPRIRRLAVLAAVVVAVLGVVAASALVFLHSRPGERMVADLAERALSDADTQVDFRDLRIGWPFTLTANSIHVSDRQGVWLRVEEPLLDWHPTRLLRDVLDIDRLAASRVVVERLPEEPAPVQEGEGAPGKGLDPFGMRLRLGEVSAPIVLEAPVLGEQVQLNLSGTFQMVGGGGEVDMRLRARHGGIARLAGTAGRDFLDLRWYLRVPEPERWQPLIGAELNGAITASGLVAGRLPNPAFTGTVNVASGGMAGVRWQDLELAFRAVPGEGAWQTTATLKVAEPALAGEQPLAPSASLEAALEVDPGARRVRITEATLGAAGAEVRVRGLVEDWGAKSDLSVATTTDLARLEPLIGRGLAGRGAVRAQVTGNLLIPDLRAVVRVDTAQFASGIAVLDRLLGDRPKARAVVRVDDALLPRLDRLAIDGARASAVAEGTVWPDIALAVRLTVPDLSVFTETLAGSGVARGRLRGPIDRLASWGVAEVEDLAVAGSPPADGKVGFDFTDIAGTPAGTVTADVMMDGVPVEGRARVVVAEDVRIEGLALRSGASEIAGTIVFRDDGPHGRLTGSIPRLAQWRSLVGAPLTGALRAEAALEGEAVRLTVEGRSLSGAGVSSQSARLQARVTGLDGDPTISGRVVAQGVQRGDLILRQLNARIDGALPRFRFEVEGDGPTGAISAAGNANVTGPRGAVALERATLSMLGREAVLAAPTRVLWGPDGMRLEPTRLAVGGGAVNAEGAVVRGRLNGEAQLRDVPLALVEMLAPDLDAVGLVDGNLNLSGTVANPVATISLRGRDVGVDAAARAGIGRLSVAVDAAWRDGVVEGEVSARDQDSLRLGATGVIPLRLGDSEAMPSGAPVRGRVEVQGDLARLTEVLPLAGHAFAGRIDGALSVGGTVGKPRLDGRVTLSDARYENLETGTLVTNLRAVAAIQGTRVDIDATGGDGRNGRARFDGLVDFGGDEVVWRGDLGLADFRALRGDDIRAEIAGDLDVSGRGTEGSLAGTIGVLGAEINIGRLQGGGVPSLDVVEVNRPGGATTAPPERGDPTGPLTIALAIDLDVNRAFVRGRGLDSEWSGDLAVAGTLGDPVLTGVMEVERGRYEFLGRVFRLSPESQVRFQGGEGIDPRLAVVGEVDAGDITARVEVGGTASAPDIAVSSQPLLPRDEVLSRVLFGTEAGKLSAFQQIQLGQLAAGGLTGGGGFDPIGGLRGILGLDVLEVGGGEDGEGGPTVSAGKYIGEDTFLRLEQGTQGGSSVTVEQELGGGFSVTTEMGDQTGGGVGLEWRKDY